MTTSEIEGVLRKLGFNKFKNKTVNRLAVLADGDRGAVLRQIEQIFKSKGAVYDPNYRTPTGAQISSLGAVLINNKIVYVRPASKQGNKSSGIGNEIEFINGINKYLDNGYGPYYTINVVLRGPGKTITIPKVLIAEGAGSDTAGRKKSDVNLIRLGLPTFPISLKKSSAEFWESADTIYGAQAVNIMETLEQRGELQITRVGNNVDFGTNISGIAIPATDEEKLNFVFGSDILGRGAIVKQTFSGDAHMSWDDSTLTLNISCIKLYDNLQQIKSSTEDPYILIRKDSYRTAGLGGVKKYSGLRVQVVYKSRLSGNVKVFPRSIFSF